MDEQTNQNNHLVTRNRLKDGEEMQPQTHTDIRNSHEIRSKRASKWKTRLHDINARKATWRGNFRRSLSVIDLSINGVVLWYPADKIYHQVSVTRVAEVINWVYIA